MKTKVCAFALAMAVVAPAIADDFTYLSGGLLRRSNKDFSEKTFPSTPQGKAGTENIFLAGGALGLAVAPKQNAMGFYLNGSAGVGDYLFVEGQVQYSGTEQQVLIGFGGHYPVTQWGEVYALAGLTKKHLQLFSGNSKYAIEGVEVLELNCKDQFRPTIEVGTKLRFYGVAGIRLSYRLAQFKPKLELSKILPGLEYSEEKNLHDVHLGGYYEVTDSCALEAGYNFTKFLKDVKEYKTTAGIRYSF